MTTCQRSLWLFVICSLCHQRLVARGALAFLPWDAEPKACWHKRNHKFPGVPRKNRLLLTQESPLALSGAVDSENEDIAPAESGSSTVSRYLGKGENAIVRTGAVLVAPLHEYHHFYRNSAIFIQGMGENEEGLYVIRGLIIDHPTPFTLEEMAKDNDNFQSNPLGQSCLWRGGDRGGDGLILLHNHPEFGQPEIGTSGLYEGGWEAAVEACASGQAKLEDFKIFFNYCEFTEEELDSLLAPGEDGDAWVSVEVNSSVILDSSWGRGDAWARLRNCARQMSG